MNDHEKYAVHKQAQENGGPCPICNWKDGDGVRTCFYSQELGIVTHQNSQQAIEASMTEEQRSLLRSYNSLHTEFEHSGDHASCVQSKSHDGSLIAGGYVVPHNCGGQFVQQLRPNEHHQLPWVCTRCGETTTVTHPRELFWPHKHVAGDHSTCVRAGDFYQFPHTCGGIGEFAGPYHIFCTGCDTEVKLWEHGVDYDLG